MRVGATTKQKYILLGATLALLIKKFSILLIKIKYLCQGLYQTSRTIQEFKNKLFLMYDEGLDKGWNVTKFK